jgi:hypothetical protein
MNNAIVFDSSPQLDKQLHVNGHIHNVKNHKKDIKFQWEIYKIEEKYVYVMSFGVMIIMASFARWLIWMSKKNTKKGLIL